MRIPLRLDPDQTVTLLVSGTLNTACVADVERALALGRELHRHVVVDLSKVRLIDRPTLQFLADLARDDVALTNCPDHVARWMRDAAADTPDE